MKNIEKQNEIKKVIQEVRDVLRSNTITTITYLDDAGKVKDKKFVKMTKTNFLNNISSGNFPVFFCNKKPEQFQIGAFYILNDGKRMWTFVKD